MKNARLIKIPPAVYDRAKQRQRELAAAGVFRPLWELIEDAYRPPPRGGFRL